MTQITRPPVYTGETLFDLLSSHVRWNLPVEALVAEAVARGEGVQTNSGALRVMTGAFTGRSPQDKYTVRRSPSEQNIDWGAVNHPLDPRHAEPLVARFVEAARRASPLYGFRGYVGRGRFRVPIALVTEYAWHTLMGRHMFVRPTPEELARHRPEFTLLYLPSVLADPETDGTRSQTVILCDLERKLGIIGGTEYGGEEKKFFFYLMNYLLPLHGAFPMHCSANVGRGGDVSLIFGLSGTGKTTLSADPQRLLIGDDEHGWDADGVFNFEGGCYAKLIDLSREQEPLIWDAVNRFGSVLENVPVGENGEPDFRDRTVENTRGVYPLDALDSVEPSGRAGHPTTIAFLTFDATGTLPPLSVLDENQALYWFLAGYTAKVAGTERGLGSKPAPTFSACFGAPFLPWSPRRYVELFREYLRRHRPQVVLMNTGSLGGPYGHGGARPPLPVTRRLLQLAQQGAFSEIPLRRHPEFGVLIPEHAPGVPAELLDPRAAWKPEAGDYRDAARELVSAFREHVNRKYAGVIDRAILDAGPKLPE